MAIINIITISCCTVTWVPGGYPIPESRVHGNTDDDCEKHELIQFSWIQAEANVAWSPAIPRACHKYPW